MHFEGRNLNAVSEMMKISRKYFPQMPLSVEIEAPRYAWNCIVPYVSNNQDLQNSNTNLSVVE